jgi:hypothetical protein
VGVHEIESEVQRSTFIVRVKFKRDQTLSSWPLE